MVCIGLLFLWEWGMRWSVSHFRLCVLVGGGFVVLLKLVDIGWELRVKGRVREERIKVNHRGKREWSSNTDTHHKFYYIYIRKQSHCNLISNSQLKQKTSYRTSVIVFTNFQAIKITTITLLKVSNKHLRFKCHISYYFLSI